MIIDIDQAIQKLEPWDLAIRIDGKDHPIRPLTNTDIFALSALGQSGEGVTPEQQEAADLKTVRELFTDPQAAPVFEGEHGAKLATAVVTMAIRYFSLRAEKNSHAAVAERAAAAVVAAASTGSRT